MSEKQTDREIDIAVTGTLGGKGRTIVIKGVSQKSTAIVVKQLKSGKRTGITLPIKDVSKVDVLGNDGNVDQTVFGNKANL